MYVFQIMTKIDGVIGNRNSRNLWYMVKDISSWDEQGKGEQGYDNYKLFFI